MAARRPKAVAFDVNETLFALDPLRDRLAAFGLDRGALEWWFAVVLREGFALAAAGDHRPFFEVANAAAIEVLEASGLPPAADAGAAVLEGFAELEPYPDVRPALTALAEAGVPALCLTNGNAKVVEGLLDRAGLRTLVGEVRSVDSAGHWKPRPEPYLDTAATAGVAPGELAMVAVHPWDVYGAQRAGLVGGWVNRTGRRYSGIFDPPDVEGASLTEVVARLLAADGG